jgi:dTDP-4-amino-4,6-dideoxygalactose transaminase
MGHFRFRVCDLTAQRERLKEELGRSIETVLGRGWFILGEEVSSFEREFASFLGVRDAVGVASGTDAIHIALACEGIGPGDEVLTTPLTAVPTACAVAMAGAKPVFADVDPETGLLDPDDAARRVTARTKALLPVHLYGQCVPMEPVLDLAARHGLTVIEDCAQAHGARWRGRTAGTMGAYGCFSFYPTKNLGAYGDAGAVVTGDPGKAERLRRMRNYGQADRYRHVTEGWNSRLDEIQAAILRVKLRRLGGWNEARRALARRYGERLAGTGVRPLRELEDGDHVYHLYVVRHPGRDALREKLGERGIESQVHYPIPVHLQESFAHLGYRKGDFPHAERLAGEVLSLPLYPELAADDVDAICGAVREILGGGVET